MEEYALLDESLFNLSNEDFTMKWGLLSWPWKITNMIQQVEETHFFNFCLQNTTKKSKIWERVEICLDTSPKK